MKEKESKELFLGLSAQDILYILESLTVYKLLMLPDNKKGDIDELMFSINTQLELEGINLYKSYNSKDMLINKKCTFTDLDSDKILEGIVLGSSPVEGLIRVAYSKNDKLEIAYIPSHIIIDKQELID